jgi:hypothetical protein
VEPVAARSAGASATGVEDVPASPARSLRSISSRSSRVLASEKLGNGCRSLMFVTMGRNFSLRPHSRVRTRVRSPTGSPNSRREAAIVSRRRQKSVMEEEPY